MLSFITTLFWFVIALGVLITIHEFGHFWVARISGVKVLRFSIGFGKPLLKRIGKKDGTEYVLAGIPLGGYVKMLDEREGEVPPEEAHRAFNRQSLPIRTAIVAAGPVFNLLFAVFAFWVLGVSGEIGSKPLVGEVEPQSIAARAGMMAGDRFVSIDGERTPTWESVVYGLLGAAVSDDPVKVSVSQPDQSPREVELLLSGLLKSTQQPEVLKHLGIEPQRPRLPPVFGKLVPHEPAADAGIQVGDRLLGVNGETVSDWMTWVRFVRDHPAQLLHLKIQRGGEVLPLELVTAEVKQGDKVIGRIGAAPRVPDGFMDDYRVKVQYGPIEALQRAVVKTWDMSVLMLKVMGRMLTGQASIQNLSGPISIAQAAGDTASIGLDYFLKFLAVVSISLGVLNLLPIPVLDGGHLLMFLIEAVKGSAVSETAMLIGQKIGIALLLSLMVVAFYVDLSRVFG